MVLKANALMAGMYTPPTPMPINALPRDAQPMLGAIPIFLIFIVQFKNFGTITKKKAALCPHLTIQCDNIFSKNRRRYHEHRAT
jgi:hypothetical protein